MIALVALCVLPVFLAMRETAPVPRPVRADPAATDAVISEPRLLRLLRIVDIAQVDQHLSAQRCSDLLEVERPKFVPLGDHHQRVGVRRRLIGVGSKLDSGENLLRLLASDRIDRR